MRKSDLLLYLVTDRGMAQGHLEEIVETAISNGVTIVQLREKQATFEEFCEKAVIMKGICKKHNIPLIINDNIEVCLAVDADGVHLGSSDCDIALARKMLGSDKIIGGSARDIERAKLLESQGADYLGVGAVFGTSTKVDAKTISPKILAEITGSVSIPVVAIGGVSESNIGELNNTGISGVAVVSAIIKAKNVQETTQNLVKQLKKIV